MTDTTTPSAVERAKANERAGGLTIGDIRALLHYDPFTGAFRWRKRRRGVRAGAIAGSVCKRGHVKLVICGRAYLGHRVAWLYVKGVWPENEIDHRDLDPGNGRFDNLRDATHAQNHANISVRKDSASGAKCVDYVKRTGRWRAYIWRGGKFKHIGYFDTKEDAQRAYAAAALQQHGQFARTA